MRAYAERGGHDVELWSVTGLLHDADYERFPDMDDTEKGHPRSIMAELERRDAPPEMVRAIASHADFMGVPPESPMERTLVAVDELCGFLVACALVRPSKSLDDLEVSSVRKKLKDKAFARAVNRDDIRQGVAELGVDLDEHVRFVIEALKPVQGKIGLRGSAED